MKKYILYSLCIFSFLPAAQQTVKVQEWDAQAYAQGNKLQYQAALYFISKSNLITAHKKILDVGCGTGEITDYLTTQNALLVHGIDASKNMISYAQETQKNKHCLSFEQCCIENYYTKQKFDLATAFSCFHWFSDQPKALERIAHCLENNGEIFLDVMTSDVPHLTGFPIVQQMLAELDSPKSISQSFSQTFITSNELKDMVLNAGFEPILFEQQICEITFANPKEVEAFVRPVMMSRPFMKELSPEKRESFFNEYIKRLLPAMKRTSDNGYIETVASTIVHARKK
jgi:trans-aconitate methyltransferase